MKNKKGILIGVIFSGILVGSGAFSLYQEGVREEVSQEIKVEKSVPKSTSASQEKSESTESSTVESSNGPRGEGLTFEGEAQYHLVEEEPSVDVELPVEKPSEYYEPYVEPQAGSPAPAPIAPKVVNETPKESPKIISLEEAVGKIGLKPGQSVIFDYEDEAMYFFTVYENMGTHVSRVEGVAVAKNGNHVERGM